MTFVPGTSKGSSAIAMALRDCGMGVMFGVMGDANMDVVHCFRNEVGGRFMSSSHENGAVLMASGYAAVTGDVGVATVTHGAIANTTSALLEAVRGRYPVLVFCGDTAATDTYNLQNVPQRDLVLPTGAGIEQARAPETLADDVAIAARRARVERRPIVLNVPVDFQDAAVTYRKPACGAAVSPPWVPAPESVDAAVEALSASQRPVVIGGRGAARPDSRAALLRLAERIGAPIATTLRGKDLFRDEPFNLGICGGLATPIAREVIAAADCLLVFGASLSSLTTDAGDLLTGKRVVQCDNDVAAFGRYYPVDVAITGDCRAAADAIIECLGQRESPASMYRSAGLARRIAEFRYGDDARATCNGLSLGQALLRLNELVDADRTLVVDGGPFCHQSLQIMNVPEPSAYVHALNVGQIGLSVGYGIGAAVGRPDRPALIVAGDGGFMLGGLTEFSTAVRHRLNVIVAVMNDGAYGAEYYRFVRRGMDPSLTTFDWPDLASVASALGGRGLRVRSAADFDQLPGLLSGRLGPVLVDVALDPATIPDPGRH